MPASERPPHVLLRHLDSLYRVAQLLTPTPREAAALVEATGRRALQHAEAHEASLDRAALLHLLLETHAERSQASTGAHMPSLEAGLHRRLAHHYLQRALPPALSALPSEQQFLLLLTEVEGLDAPEAARVLELPLETVSERLRSAHRLLHDALYRQGGEAERELLRDHATPTVVGDGLRHLLRSERSPVPQRLRKAVAEWASAPEADVKEADASEGAARDEAAAGNERRFHRALISILLVIAAGLAGWLATELIDQPAPTTAFDVLQRSAAHADAVQPTLETSDASRAEAYAFEATGQRVTLPTLRRSELLGVGTDEVVPGVRVPVFLYRGTDDAPSVALFTYSYALLDRAADRLTLPDEMRERIQDEQRFGRRRLDDRDVLVWRRRDDIYVAVTEGDAADLQDRLQWDGP